MKFVKEERIHPCERGVSGLLTANLVYGRSMSGHKLLMGFAHRVEATTNLRLIGRGAYLFSGGQVCS